MAEKSNEDIDSFHCCTCGIYFGIDKEVVKLWKNSHKGFVCPNGHNLAWNGESSTDKEIKALKEEVKSLKEKLAAAEAQAASEKKRADELATELEIWRPVGKAS